MLIKLLLVILSLTFEYNMYSKRNVNHNVLLYVLKNLEKSIMDYKKTFTSNVN